MSTTRIVGILPSNCNDKNAKIGFQAVTCDLAPQKFFVITCMLLYVLALVPLEIILVTKLSVQLRLIFDYCC